MVLARVGVVEGGAGRSCGADRVQRRVLAEVLHPAVIAVLDRLAGDGGEGLAPRLAAEVELGDVEGGRGRVAEKVGLAEPVLDQPAAGRRGLEDGVIAGADHRVQVGGDGQAPLVHAPAPAPAPPRACRPGSRRAGSGCRSGRPKAGHPRPGAGRSARACCSVDPVGCTQGPNSQGAAGAGWRPVSRVKRRRASAGRRAGEEPQPEPGGRRRRGRGRTPPAGRCAARRSRTGPGRDRSSRSRGRPPGPRSRRWRAAKGSGSRSRPGAGGSPTWGRSPRSASTRSDW